MSRFKRILIALLAGITLSASLPLASLANLDFGISADAATTIEIWDGTIASGFAKGDGTEESPYCISNGQELAYLQQQVNSGNSYSGTYFSITADIYLNDVSDYKNWSTEKSPANTWDGLNDFGGIISGHGYTIYGLYMNREDANVGFINKAYNIKDDEHLGYNYSNLAVKNLMIKNAFISGSNYVGGILGYSVAGTTIENCSILESTVCADGIVGGIVGGQSVTITGCRNEYASTKISGGIAGGIIGEVSGTINFKSEVSNCSNYSRVVGSISGGVIGYIYRGINDKGCSIKRLFNGSYDGSSVSGGSSAGGIIGKSMGSDGSISLQLCYNTGTVSGKEFVGGIVGDSRGTDIVNCYNTGKISGDTNVGGIAGEINPGSFTGNVSKCFNYGEVKGKEITTTNAIVGLKWVSGPYQPHISSSYYLEGTVENNGEDNGSALTAQQFKEEENFQGFDFTDVWTMGDQYPKFKSLVKSGTCGENATWKLYDDGVLVISGTGDMYDYTASQRAPWGQKNGWVYGEIKKVIIEDGITSVGNYAFWNDYYDYYNFYDYYCNLTKVILPNSITKIGDNAFYRCYAMKSCDLPENLQSVGSKAFARSGITKLKIPSSLEEFPSDAFYSTCLQNIEVENGNLYYCVEDNVLFNKEMTKLVLYPRLSKTENYIIPDSVTEIENYAFYYSYYLKNITFPVNLKKIGKYAFYECTKIENITFPMNLEEIDDNAFYNCNFPSVDFPSKLKRIGDYAFYGCNQIQEVIWKNDSTLSLGAGAFRNCASLSKVDLSNVELGSAFADCVSLTEVHLENVPRIGGGAFNGCTALTEISIPDGVTSIGSYAFKNTSVEEIYIPDSVTSIEEGAFYNCTKLTKVRLSNQLKSLGFAVFCQCFSLKSLIIPDGVEKIEARALWDCDKLKWISLPTSIKFINYQASDGAGISDVYYMGTQEEARKITREFVSTDAIHHATWHYGEPIPSEDTTGETDSDVTTNSEIIQRVQEYCSDEIYAQLVAIMNENLTNDEYLQRLTALFLKQGITDPLEGIKYVSNTQNKRSAYLTLTTDKMYCANNYYEWLEKNPAAKATLWASGLLLNGEIDEYFDITHLADGEYPYVARYKAMLYDFMDYTSSSIEVQSTIKTLSTLSSKTTDATKIAVDDFLSKLSTCDVREISNLLESKEAEGIWAKLENENGEFSFKLDETSGFGQFAKAMGIATKTISIADMAIDDIRDLIELDSKLAVYAQYKTFLEEIRSNTKEYPYQLCYAAELILEEIEDGYIAEIKDIALDVLGKTKITSTVWESILEGTGYTTFSGWLEVVGITSFFIDKATGVTDMLEKSTYVAAYAKLASVYEKKLETAKQNFQQNSSENNAWDFYYNYNILYRLRYKGEESYLEMTKVGGLLGLLYDFGYTVKKEAVNDTLKILEEKCQFTLDESVQLPESCQFAAKSVISCPVDIEVYDSKGELITTLKDGVESDISNEHGRFVVTFDSYSGEYVKVICLNNKDDYKFKLIGIDDGLVDMETAYYDAEDQVERYAFDNVMIQKNDALLTSISQIVEQKTYDVDYDNDGSIEKTEPFTIVENNIPLDSISLNKTELAMQVGTTETLSVTVTPENATTKSVIWNSADSSIATVANGKITAVAPGTTKIYCTPIGNSEAVMACSVTVKASQKELSALNATLSSTTLTYTGSELKPTVTVYDGDIQLVENTDYTVEYSKNIDVGTAVVKIIGKGNYTGEMTKTFSINPASTSTETESTNENTGNDSIGSTAPSTPTTPDQPQTPVDSGDDGLTGEPDDIAPSGETVTHKDGSTTTTEIKVDGNTTTTTITDADANQKITKVTQVIEIQKIGSNTDATIKIVENGSGNVLSATTTLDKVGAVKENGVQGTFTKKVLSQIKKTVGENVYKKMTITMVVKNEKGAKQYSITANAVDLTPSNTLYIYKQDADGNYVMVNAKEYTTDAKGQLKLTLKSKNDFVMLNEKEAKAATKAVLSTVKASKTKATVSKSKTTTMKLDSGLNMANVKSVVYKTSKSGIATVDKKTGKITAKKAGKATVSAVVTLKNGKTKTVKMTVNVK